MRVVLLLWVVWPLLRRGTAEDWSKVFEESLNVRTVLFREMDGCKACWSRGEINLLLARRMMQDLIPKKPPKDFCMTLKYIKSSIDVLRTRAPPADLPVMMRAMYDTFGGYLKAVVIPMVNEAYYAGNVEYDVISELHGLLGEMMAFLGTNGEQWSAPVDMRKVPTKVAALPISICKQEESCKALLLRPEESGASDRKDCAGGTESKVPLPFLDDNAYPNAIAVPFKDHSLFSLMTKCSSNLLPKYYIVSMRCLASPRFKKEDVISFNHLLHRWIISHVVPHLYEPNRWYPGFGGVMRIIETMNQRGLASSEEIKADMVSSNKSIPCEDIKVYCPDEWPLWMIILAIAVCVALIAGICLIICCCCLRGKPGKEEDDQDGCKTDYTSGESIRSRDTETRTSDSDMTTSLDDSCPSTITPKCAEPVIVQKKEKCPPQEGKEHSAKHPTKEKKKERKTKQEKN